MKKRILLFLMAILMVLGGLGSSIFAQDAPSGAIVVDKATYKAGEAISAKFVIYNTNFSSTAINLHYNTEKMKLAGPTRAKAITADFYNNTEETGIFTASNQYFGVHEDQGLVNYSFIPDLDATDPIIKTNETPHYRYLEGGTQGYEVCSFNLVATADCTLDATDFAFQNDPIITGGKDLLINLGDYVLATDPQTTISVPEVPKAAGTVHVTIDDQGHGSWSAKAVDADLPFMEGDTIADLLEREVKGKDLGQGVVSITGLPSYISSINGLNAAGMNGWMVTLNDWFISEGINSKNVATLSDGDAIAFFYSTSMGEDEGGSWGNNNKSIKALTTSVGTLSPAFNGDTKEYTLSVDPDTTSVVITPTAFNKNFQVRTSVDGTEYKRNAAIPVTDGTTLTVKCGDPAWPSMNSQAGGTAGDVPAQTYTIKVEVPKSKLSGLLVHTGYNPSGKNVLLQNEGDTYGDAQKFNQDTTDYTLTTQLDTANQLRFRPVVAEEGAMATLIYTDATGAEKSKDITWSSGSSNWENCLKPGKNTLKILVTPPEESTSLSQTYTLHLDVTPTLTALKATVDGTTVYLDKAFSAATNDYTIALPKTAETITFDATSRNQGYTLTYNGEEGAALSLADTNKVEVALTAGVGEDALTNTYTLNLNKVDAGVLSFKLNPTDAIVKVYDQTGAEVKATEDQHYTGLFSAADYTYTVTKTGYVAQSGTVPKTGGALDITLEKAGEQPAAVDASWKNFRGNDNNNGITATNTPASAAEATLLWNKKLGSGWTASPSVQIIVDDSLIVMSGTNIYKLDLATGDIKATGTMAGSPSFSYTPPTYADGMIFAPLGSGTIQAFDAATLKSLWIYKDEKGGQALSPITYADGYLYTGFWNGETKDANYICLSVTDEDSTKTDEAKLATWKHTQTGGFYWAGSIAVGNAIVIGTDDGIGSFDGNSTLYALDKTTGAVISEITMEGLGDQRSTIAREGNALYFTTKNGYLCRVDVDGETGALTNLTSKSYPDLGTQSTSTPVIYKGRVYFGLGGGVGSAGKFVCCDATSLEAIYTADLPGYPQCSMLLSTVDEAVNGNLYFYSTYNSNPGGIALMTAKADGTTATKTDLYDAAGFSQYCICSVIAGEDGTLYYKNDSGNVFAVGKNADAKAADTVEAKINALKATESLTLADQGDVVAARAAYTALSDTAKTMVEPSVLTKLANAEAQMVLLTKKAQAKTALDTYKNADRYRDAQKAELSQAIADGKAAIDAAADEEAINTALTAAKTAMDAIKTDAQLDSEEATTLAEAKTAAIVDLKAYKNKDDYRSAEQAQLAKAIEEGEKAINAVTLNTETNDLADAKAKISTALATAKTTMDTIKTDAQYVVEENKAAAAKVDQIITALPAVDAIKLNDADQIAQARKAYEALTDSQKAYVTTLNTLKAAEAQLADLQASEEAAPAMTIIKAATATITQNKGGSAAAKADAEKAYASLSAAAKAKAQTDMDAMNAATAKTDADNHQVILGENKTITATHEDGSALSLDVKVKVTPVDDSKTLALAMEKKKDQSVLAAYEIHLEDMDGKTINPEKSVVITLSCDLSGYDIASLAVVHIKDGKATLVKNPTYTKGVVSFSTKDFSTFVVTAKKAATADGSTTPGTNAGSGTTTTATSTATTTNTKTGVDTQGYGLMAAILLMGLAGTVMVIYKRKENH